MGNINCCETEKVFDLSSAPSSLSNPYILIFSVLIPTLRRQDIPPSAVAPMEDKEDTKENIDDAWNRRRRHPEQAEAATRGSKGSAGISRAGSTSLSQGSTATFSPAAPFAAVTNALLMLLRVATASNRGTAVDLVRCCSPTYTFFMILRVLLLPPGIPFAKKRDGAGEISACIRLVWRGTGRARKDRRGWNRLKGSPRCQVRRG